jgi:hypothetical protein
MTRAGRARNRVWRRKPRGLSSARWGDAPVESTEEHHLTLCPRSPGGGIRADGALLPEEMRFAVITARGLDSSSTGLTLPLPGPRMSIYAGPAC